VSYISLRESGILQDAMEKESPFVAEVLLSGVIQSAGGINVVVLLHIRLLWGGFCYKYINCGVVSATCMSIVLWFLLHVGLLPTIYVYVAETTTIDVHVAETTPQ
jgi:hypothetical protein